MGLRVLLVLIGSVLGVVLGFTQCTNKQQCVLFEDCPKYQSYVGTSYKFWPRHVRKEVRELVCGSENRINRTITKICCSPKHSGRDLLDLENCGKQSAYRVAHGKIAQVFQFPWMALLGGINGNFHCGGSLIARSFVLTAAHCNKQKVFFVRVGETYLSTLIDCIDPENNEDCAEPYQDIPVAQFIRHHSYSVSRKKNDIALVKLTKPARLNDNVRPICLPLPELVPSKLPSKMVVSGWGYTEDRSETSNELRYARIPIVEQNQCRRSLRRLSDAYTVDESQVCAGADSSLADNCEGDSGGPLQYPGGKGFVIHGVVAWGLTSCGVESAPGVYTKVSHYLDWIIDNLK